MKKILILANNDVGLYKFRKELIRELSDQGNSIYVSIPNGEFVQPLVDMGCTFIDTEIDRRGKNPFTDIKLIITYSKMINKIKPEMVIKYTIKPNIYGGLICRLSKTPYVSNITGLGTSFQKDGILKTFVVLLYRLSLKESRMIFFENEESQQIFIDNKIVTREKTCRLHGAGVNLLEFQFCHYPPNNDEIHFLFIGRIMKEKGIDELLAAAKKIKKKYSNVVFDIVGGFEEDYKDTLLKLQERGIINYHGFQIDVKPFIEKTNCFILPSYHEGMANTLLECGAMGRPLITSDIYGCKEAVIDEVNGYLVNVSDFDDLYAKIERFINIPYIEKVKMGMASRNLIAENFDKKDIVNRTIERLFN